MSRLKMKRRNMAIIAAETEAAAKKAAGPEKVVEVILEPVIEEVVEIVKDVLEKHEVTPPENIKEVVEEVLVEEEIIEKPAPTVKKIKKAVKTTPKEDK
jgi:hypothetical protein